MISIILIAYSIGTEPKASRLAIVNHEIRDFSQCKIHLNHSNDCKSGKFSCYALDFMKDEFVMKVFYDTVDEAFRDARRNELTGILFFGENFTEYVMSLRRNRDFFKNRTNYVNFVFTTSQFNDINFMKFRLSVAFEDFIKWFSIACKRPAIFYKFPMMFEKPIFGKDSLNFQAFAIPSLLLQLSINSSFS